MAAADFAMRGDEARGADEQIVEIRWRAATTPIATDCRRFWGKLG